MASPPAFSQVLDMLHNRGTLSLAGLPPGDFGPPIFDVALKSTRCAGSHGTRQMTVPAVSLERHQPALRDLAPDSRQRAT
jgi:propanol-preferring alcohol dehydrogenase